jgi:hypothetical protein
MAQGRAGMTSFSNMQKHRPLRRQRNDHNFGWLIMLAVTAGTFCW